MSRVDVMDEIAEILRKPMDAIARWKECSGGKVVGCLACMPPFAPEEMIHAAGMLPVCLWGAEIPVRLADAKLQSFACSVARTSLELGLSGTLSVCDAFVFPSTCDAFQNLSEVWKATMHKPCFEVTFPRGTDSSPARRYLERELERFRRDLEAFSGVTVDEAALGKSLQVYADHRRLMRELDRARARHPGFLSARQTMEVVLSASFLPKEAHADLVRSLLASVPEAGSGAEKTPAQGRGPVRLYLTGVMARPAAIPAALEELGVWVVGDDLGLGSLYYAIEIPEGGSRQAALAEGYLRYPPCSTIHRPSPARATELIGRVRRRGAEGVLILATKFCEPEFFDAPQLREDLNTAGIPSILLETELGMAAPASVRTRVEAFVETLKEKKR